MRAIIEVTNKSFASQKNGLREDMEAGEIKYIYLSALSDVCEITTMGFPLHNCD